MLTIHAVRTGHQVLISQDEFTLLIQKVLEIQPVIVEEVADDEMTEDDLRAYYEAKAEGEKLRKYSLQMSKPVIKFVNSRTPKERQRIIQVFELLQQDSFQNQLDIKKMKACMSLT